MIIESYTISFYQNRFWSKFILKEWKGGFSNFCFVNFFLCQHHSHKWWKRWTNFYIFLHQFASHVSSIEFEFDSVKVKFNLWLDSHDQHILLLLLHNLSLFCGLLAEFPSFFYLLLLLKDVNLILSWQKNKFNAWHKPWFPNKLCILTSVLWQNMCNTLNKNGHQLPNALSTDVQNTGLKSFEVLKQRVYMKKFHNIHYTEPPRVQIGNASSSQKNELRVHSNTKWTFRYCEILKISQSSQYNIVNNFRKNIPWILATLAHSFHKNPLCELHWISLVPGWWKFNKKIRDWNRKQEMFHDIPKKRSESSQ
jgi:hypothetical protein